MPDIDLDEAIEACLRRIQRTVRARIIGAASITVQYQIGTPLMSLTCPICSGHDKFITDISRWDTSGVTDMSNMFHACESFNIDIGSWDVSNVLNM